MQDLSEHDLILKETIRTYHHHLASLPSLGEDGTRIKRVVAAGRA